MAGYFSRQRKKIGLDLSRSSLHWKLSPRTYANYRQLITILPAYIHGTVLDAGAGSLAAKYLLKRYTRQYISMDVEARHLEVDRIDDIQTLSSFENESLDVIYSAQVLEHVPRPWLAFAQFNRVLKSGGYAVITVPHMAGLHEEPYDFYRFTPHSLKLLSEENGLDIVESRKMGGVLSFVFHPLCMLLVLSFWSVPGVKWVVYWLNFSLLVWPCELLDRALGLERKFPANLLIVARKRRDV